MNIVYTIHVSQVTGSWILAPQKMQPALRKPMTDLGAVAPPMGERVPQGIVFEEIAAVFFLKMPSLKKNLVTKMLS